MLAIWALGLGFSSVCGGLFNFITVDRLRWGTMSSLLSV